MKWIFALLILSTSAVGVRTADNASRLFWQPTVKEITRVLTAIRADARRPDTMVVISAGLKEPSKKSLLDDPASLVREIAVTVRDPRTRRLYNISGNAETGQITEWMRVDLELQSLNADDILHAESIIRAHKGWLAGLRRRGIDSSTVAIAVWPSGIPKSSFNTRIVRCIAWVMTNGVNLYNRPIEGLVCTVNLDQRRVIEFYDREEAPTAMVVPTAKRTKQQPAMRAAMNSAIKVDGNTITWKQWTFDATVRDRDGLVLTRLRWLESGVLRSVAHRLGISEIAAVNGDTSSYWYWRNALVAGEYGLGRNTTSLLTNIDVPQQAKLFDAACIGANGLPRAVKNAVGIYERESDVVWKRVDPQTGAATAERMSELVVTHQSNINSLIYQTSYILGSDGSVTIDVGVGGVALAKGTIDTITNADSPNGQSTGRLGAKNIALPFVAHYVNVRCDLDVDGTRNVISEVEFVKPLAEVDQYKNAVTVDDYEMRFEREAQRSLDGSRARRWRVTSTGTKSALGQQPSYVLIPSNTTPVFVQTPNLMNQRAPFIETPFWCTQYDAAQLYAAGEYPMQSSGVEDLGEYVADNASIYRKDLVVWHTMGLFFVPRTEDWPVMPMQHVSMKLVPDGFVKNPFQD